MSRLYRVDGNYVEFAQVDCTILMFSYPYL